MNILSPAFPVEDPVGPRQLARTHEVREVTPLGQPSLAYALLLPKGWLMQEDLGAQEGGVGRLVRVGLFADRSGPDAAVVQVSYAFFPLEVGLWDWMEFQARRFGVRLLHRRYKAYACGPVVDAGGTYGPPDDQYVVRVIATANEGRIFHVLGMTRAQFYPRWQRDFFLATSSFRLVQPGLPGRLEQWLTFEAGPPVNFRVSHPASWQPRNVPKVMPGKKAVDIVLEADNEMKGYLRVKAVEAGAGKPVTPDQFLRTAAEELEDTRVRLLSPWEPDMEPLRGLNDDVKGLYRTWGKYNQADFELRCGIVRRGPLFFVLTLMTVPRQAKPLLWMRCKRAYEIALSTVEPA